MKRALIASLLGLTISTRAFGDGVILFNNYTASNYQQAQVFWANNPLLGSLAGKPVDDGNVEVQLFWALGTYPNQSAFDAVANAGQTTFIVPGFNYKGGGYYAGQAQILTGWTSSQTVTFDVRGWQTAGPYGGPTYATSDLKGESAMWTETAAPNGNAHGIQPLGNPETSFANGPPAMILDLPEPSPFALSTLSATALMLFRRRKSK